ncbi:MAG: SUMF1/EgtB/PvdO family nonheme iron enzyme [Pseudomonadota bacterium]
MTSVSILHASKDEKLGEKIARALLVEGHAVTKGPAEGGAAALSSSPESPTVVVWSPAARQDAGMLAQAKAALAADTLIPVSIAAADPPPGFDQVAPVDLTGWSGDPGDPRWRFVVDEINLAAQRDLLRDHDPWERAAAPSPSLASVGAAGSGETTQKARLNEKAFATVPEAATAPLTEEKPVAAPVADTAEAFAPQEMAPALPGMTAPRHMPAFENDEENRDDASAEEEAMNAADSAFIQGELFSDVAQSQDIAETSPARKRTRRRAKGFSPMQVMVGGFATLVVATGALVALAPVLAPDRDAPPLRADAAPGRDAAADSRSAADGGAPETDAATARIVQSSPAQSLPAPALKEATAQTAAENLSRLRNGDTLSGPYTAQNTDGADSIGPDDGGPDATPITPTLAAAVTPQPALDGNVADNTTFDSDIVTDYTADDLSTDDPFPFSAPVPTLSPMRVARAASGGEEAPPPSQDVDAEQLDALVAAVSLDENVASDSEEVNFGHYFRDCLDCPDMAALPPGEFLMGAAPDENARHESEAPRRRVSLIRGFAIATKEVTFKQWDACVADGGCNRYRASDAGWGRGRQPAVNVSYNDALAYAEWLSAKTGRRYRLPSEAEWEYAARAGAATPFSFGGRLSTDRANYNGAYGYNGARGVNRARPIGVASFAPNAFGLYDMHGNVWEWTADCWAPSHEGAPSDGSPRGGDCSERVLKGGAFNTGGWRLRSAHRIPKRSAARESDNGFRLVRDID